MRYRMLPTMGAHYMKGGDGKRVIVSPGDVIDCEEKDIGGAMFKFEPAGGDGDNPIVITTIPSSVVPVGEGMFNVVNRGSGAPFNDVPLTPKEAADLAGVPESDLLEVASGQANG